jgi:beta-1,3-galactosyltransferase / beta-1,3-N-acetylglucosaminyltransferase
MIPRNRRLYVKLLRYSCSIVFMIFLCDYLGIFTHFFEEKIENFKYPYEGDIRGLCNQIKKGQKPDINPINNISFSYRHNNENKCKDDMLTGLLTPHLLIIVKSKIDHFEQRNAIRNSWGFEKRFSDVIIRTIFTLGIDRKTHNGEQSEIQKLVDLETEQFQDIIQVIFNFLSFRQMIMFFLYSL